MQLWRIAAAVLLAVGGLVLMLLAMAKARESRGSDNTRVIAAGAIVFFVTVVLIAAVLTVLPALASWVLVGVVLVVVSVMALAS